jgi:hypothetical protein
MSGGWHRFSGVEPSDVSKVRPPTTFGKWENGRCRVCIRGHDFEIFHVIGIPPYMNRVWFRAKHGDQLDPVPMANKYTALIARLERKFG